MNILSNVFMRLGIVGLVLLLLFVVLRPPPPSTSSLLASATSSSAVPTFRAIQNTLFYGDSLTHGTSPPGSPHPYRVFAEQYLRQQEKLRDEMTFSHVGFPGITAGTLVDQAETAPNGLAHLADLWVQYSQISLVVLLIGTNDLGRRRDVADIVRDVERLHALLHARHAFTVSVAIPASGFTERDGDANEKRVAVNDKLEEFCKEREACLAFVAAGEFQKELMAPDSLHYNEAGYKELGEKIARVIAPFLVE